MSSNDANREDRDLDRRQEETGDFEAVDSSAEDTVIFLVVIYD